MVNVKEALERIESGFRELGFDADLRLNPEHLGVAGVYLLSKRRDDGMIDMDGDVWLRIQSYLEPLTGKIITTVDFHVGPNFWLEYTKELPVDGS